MLRTLGVIGACALALVCCAPGKAQDSSPSLGDLARQAQKDKANKPAAKVITNDDMPSTSVGAGASISGGLGQLAPGQAGSGSSAQLSPTEKLAQLEKLLNVADSLDKTTLARSVLQDKKDVDFPGRARWEDRMYAAKQLFVTQNRELIDRARQIIASADSLKGTPDPNDPRVKEVRAQLEALVQDSVRADSALQAVAMEGRDLASQGASH